MSIPNTHRALVVAEGNKGAIVTEKKLPSLTSNEILINVKAVTLNPTDNWHIYSLLKPGDSTGSDFAGLVVEIGREAQNKGIKVGDSVAGFIRGGTDDPANGAFQEYVKSRPELVWRKPETFPYKDAAALGGVASSTAAWALYRHLGVSKPWESKPTSGSSGPILIWAGSTAVGLNAVALAKLSGLTVITTASPRNHALLKSVGADAVFDYRDPSVVSKIRHWVAEKGFGAIGIHKALDSITKDGSTKLVAESLGDQGGKIVTLLGGDPDAKYPKKVEIKYIGLYDVLDEGNKEDSADIKEWNENLPVLIEKRGFRNPVPLKVAKGLEAIPSGLEYLASGKVSAEKLTYDRL